MMIDSIETEIIAMILWHTIPVMDLLCPTAKFTLNTITHNGSSMTLLLFMEKLDL